MRNLKKFAVMMFVSVVVVSASSEAVAILEPVVTLETKEPNDVELVEGSEGVTASVQGEEAVVGPKIRHRH